MPVLSVPAKPRSWLWSALTSIRLTVFLLIILALLAIIGTVIPQDLPPGHYLHRYGEGWGGFLLASGLSRVYQSLWFLAPLGLLLANLSACLVHGLPQAVRRCLAPFTPEQAEALPPRGRCQWPPGVEPHARIAAVWRRELGRRRLATFPDREIYYGQWGRWRPLGPYLIHLGLVCILLGGLVGKFLGVEGRMPILVGEEASSFRGGLGSPIPLNFQVRLDRFQVDFYEPGGPPKEFRSDLTFLKKGQAEPAVCRVNDPVEFGGYTFYQSSYGAQHTGPVRLTLRQGGAAHTLETPFRRAVDLPGGLGQIMLVRVEGDLQGFGPAVQVAYRHGPGHPEIYWLFKDHPEQSQQPEKFKLELSELPFAWFSVFQVKRDPGVWWVYAGFILFLPGFYLAFFRPAQRWAVVLRRNAAGGYEARVLAASPREREAFEERQARFIKGLQGEERS